MAATRKIVKQASDEDLAQMQNIFGSNKQNVQPVKQIEQDIQVTQVDNSTNVTNFTNSTTQQIESVAVSKLQTQATAEQIETVADSKMITEEHKSTSDTTVGIRMTTAKKREMKAYFIQHGTTMSQGVIDAFTLLKTLEAEGLVSYTDGMLKRN